MAQQIPVRSRLSQGLIAFPAALPYGQGQGAVRIGFLDVPYDPAQPLVRKIAVLASLKDKGPKAQAVALPAALQDLLLPEAVALRLTVAPADPAVIAVVSAIVRKFNEAPDVDPVPEDPVPDPGGQPGGMGRRLRASFLQHKAPLLRREHSSFHKPVQKRKTGLLPVP